MIHGYNDETFDKEEIYKKSDIDTKLDDVNTKLNNVYTKNDVYTKTEVDEKVYTQDEVNTLISNLKSELTTAKKYAFKSSDFLIPGGGAFIEFYPNNGYLEVSRCGNVVQLMGTLTSNANITSDNDVLNFIRLTSAENSLGIKFRPMHNVRVVCNGSSAYRWLLTVNVNGDVGISRYGSGANDSIPKGAFLPIHAMWIVQD